MGLLESAIGGVLGQVFGGQRQGSGGMSPLVKALLMLLLAKGASGGFGDIFGRGRQGEPGPEADRSGGAGPYGRDPGQHPADGGGRGFPNDTGDIGGFDQSGGRRDTGPADPSLPPGDFSDLSGMLDGPGEAPARRGAAPDGQGDLGGLDGLVDRFRQGGLGDVIESWIGHGANRPVAPDQLAHALGPDTLDTLQSQTGMDRATLLSQLAQALPEVVHALTPQGRVPGAEERRGW
ncbi:YidB family protein [Methylobacterium sp. NEAU K]|uniref:YidB family protein n=1 Tax=Methylobacterium sp. NEAU K TaxID=3064946 RepID=UPI002734B0BF|nr:YidB family protein [Methylobacterium sp. NEAU K]MDP4003746.1 YidB family protein [Methylobacterium sp. NEAU K]